MYINKEDYLKFDGIDLEVELPDDDNSKNKANRFIEEVELWTITQLKMRGFNEKLVNETNEQFFKYGLLYQVRHFLRKGRDNQLDANALSLFTMYGFVRMVAY